MNIDNICNIGYDEKKDLEYAEYLDWLAQIAPPPSYNSDLEMDNFCFEECW